MGIRKLAGLLMVVALVAVLLIPGCAPEGEGEVTPPPAEEHEELELIMATYVPPAYKDLWPSIGDFPENVNKAGKGIVHIDFYHSGTLLDAKTLLPGLMAGTADLVYETDSYLMGSYPIMGMRCLPFLSRNVEEVGEFQQETAPGTPIANFVNKQLAKKNMYEIAYAPVPENLFTADRAVRSPSDTKGLKIRAAGAIESRVVSAMGAAPTSMPSAEVYLALQRGTVDGAMCYAGTVDARALYELIKYANTAPFTTYALDIIVPLDRWNSWPKDVQDVLIEQGTIMAHDLTAQYLEYAKTNYWPVWAEKYGMTIIQPTDEEYNALKEASKPVYDWWLEQVEPEVGNEALRLLGVE